MRTTHQLRAFTLIELLVVLALIALIVGILLVAMGGVRSSTRRVESSNALRQMVAAYDAYSTDHNKRLMPGFVTASQVADFNIAPKTESGSLHSIDDAQGYVWRLAPYLGHKWETMFVDYGSKSLESTLAKEYAEGIFGPGTLTNPATQFGIARVPSFGLNSIFLGGDAVHGGPDAVPFNPWNATGNESIAATRFTDVKTPAHMIVFAPVKQANVNVNPTLPFRDLEFGFPELRAPFLTLLPDGTWGDQQWELEGDGSTIKMSLSAETIGAYAEGGGLPVARWGGAAFPVGNLDGSISVETPVSLSNDMTRWSHQAKGHFLND
jgi:prepilin-type N-terminal cleavage/methylation domain-containing protein